MVVATGSVERGSAVARATLLVVFPVTAAIIGAPIAYEGGVQHYAAGVVFASVAVEVLPEIRDESLVAVALGFAAGGSRF